MTVESHSPKIQLFASIYGQLALQSLSMDKLFSILFFNMLHEVKRFFGEIETGRVAQSVGHLRKYVHAVLINRFGGLSLPRKSAVRLTGRPDMTLDVYRGRKTTIQQRN